MAKLRRTTVTKREGKWGWHIGASLWQWKAGTPGRLWRNGFDVPGACKDVPILCIDDAIVFSKGYEYHSGIYEDGSGVLPSPFAASDGGEAKDVG